MKIDNKKLAALRNEVIRLDTKRRKLDAASVKAWRAWDKDDKNAALRKALRKADKKHIEVLDECTEADRRLLTYLMSFVPKSLAKEVMDAYDLY
jgi:uncharacterized membrane protein